MNVLVVLVFGFVFLNKDDTAKSRLPLHIDVSNSRSEMAKSNARDYIQKVVNLRGCEAFDYFDKKRIEKILEESDSQYALEQMFMAKGL